MPFLGSSIAPEQVRFIQLEPAVGKVHISDLVRRDERRKSVLAFLQECRRVAQTSTALHFEKRRPKRRVFQSPRSNLSA